MGGSIGQIFGNSLFKIILGGIITVAVAIASGILIAKGINAKRDDDYRISRDIKTQEILNKMGTIQIGGAIPDHLFLDSTGKGVALSDIIEDVLVLCYIDPGCGACIENLRCMANNMKNTNHYKKVWLVSDASSSSIEKLQQQAGSNFNSLNDDGHRFSSNLNINTTPLTLVVSRELIIEHVFIGGLTNDECETIAKMVRNTNN